MAKEGIIARQFMLGLVQTAQGVPLHHKVFEGNTAEVGTLKGALQKVMDRFPVQRVIAVADRGLPSLDNLEELQAMRLFNGQPLEFILAVPGRRYREFAELLEPVNEAAASAPTAEIIAEQAWQGGLRLVVAHDRDRALEQSTERDQRIAWLEAQAAQWAGKLDAQDVGVRSRGRALSDGGVRARLRESPVENVASPERALSILRRIQTHRIVLDGKRDITGISNLDAEQQAILKSLQVRKPTSADTYINL